MGDEIQTGKAPNRLGFMKLLRYVAGAVLLLGILGALGLTFGTTCDITGSDFSGSAQYDCSTRDSLRYLAAGVFGSAFFTAIFLYIAANVIELLLRIEELLEDMLDAPPFTLSAPADRDPEGEP